MDKYEYQLKTEHIRRCSQKRVWRGCKAVRYDRLDKNPRRKNADTGSRCLYGSRRV